VSARLPVIRRFARAPAAAILLVSCLAPFASGCAFVGLAIPPGVDASTLYPGGCAKFGFSQRRCDAVVEAARQEVRGAQPAVMAVELLGDEENIGGNNFITGGEFVARVRFHFLGGGDATQKVFCDILDDISFVCSEHPFVRIAMDFNWDTPCVTPGPVGPCATPRPTPDKAAVAQARPLKIASEDFPLASTGHQEIRVGEAVLPNGYLTEARARLADERPQAFHVNGYVWLELRPTDPKRPPFKDSLIQRPLQSGPERVEVFLVLDVIDTSPNAALQIRDLVVR
jgi:hypothetical protein